MSLKVRGLCRDAETTLWNHVHLSSIIYRPNQDNSVCYPTMPVRFSFAMRTCLERVMHFFVDKAVQITYTQAVSLGWQDRYTKVAPEGVVIPVMSARGMGLLRPVFDADERRGAAERAFDEGGV